MKITVNGEEGHVEEGSTVLVLLESYHLDPEITVVEINGDIIQKEQFSSTRLAENNHIELIRFMGGG